MYDDTRARIKARYNRRFYVGAHLAALLMLILVSAFVPWMGMVTLTLGLALIPHALYVAYKEYTDWVERRVDDEMYGPPAKAKRYPEDEVEPGGFRLTDDGEIEPIGPEKPKNGYDQPRAYSREDARRSRQRGYDDDDDDDRRDRHEKKRRRRKHDTDEFDVKEIFEKLKDIID